MATVTIAFGERNVTIVSDEPFIPLQAVETAATITHGTRAALNDINIRSDLTKEITPAMLAVAMASKRATYPTVGRAMARGLASAMLGISNITPDTRRESCADCGGRIGPGRIGRKCSKCR
jgi:hypothetical protein